MIERYSSLFTSIFSIIIIPTLFSKWRQKTKENRLLKEPGIAAVATGRDDDDLALYNDGPTMMLQL